MFHNSGLALNCSNLNSCTTKMNVNAVTLGKSYLISDIVKVNETTVIVLQTTERRTKHFQSNFNRAQIERQGGVVSPHVVVVEAS